MWMNTSVLRIAYSGASWANTLDLIGRKIRNADGAASIQRWMELFE